ncbi:hypothetical protein L7F22_064959 [Adiantum nelumboides]|nr:hypothetical protein [Adiantum nelumboides]
MLELVLWTFARRKQDSRQTGSVFNGYCWKGKRRCLTSQGYGGTTRDEASSIGRRCNKDDVQFCEGPEIGKIYDRDFFLESACEVEEIHNTAPETRSQETFISQANSEKELEEVVDERIAQLFDAQKKAKKHGKKQKQHIDFPNYLGRQSTFEKATKQKKRVRFEDVPSSSSFSSDSSSDSSEEDRKGKKRSKKQRFGKGKKNAKKSKSRPVNESSTEDSSLDSSDPDDGNFYANKRNFYKAYQYDFLEDKSKKVREFKEGGQSIKFDTFSGYKDASKAVFYTAV